MTQKDKALAYTAIALVGIGFFLILSLAVLRPMINRNREQQIRTEEQVKAEQQKAKEKIEIAQQQVQDVKSALVEESVKHTQETKIIKLKYFEKTAKLDATLRAIDTIRTAADFGTFSVREMLSDSAGQLRR